MEHNAKAIRSRHETILTRERNEKQKLGDLITRPPPNHRVDGGISTWRPELRLYSYNSQERMKLPEYLEQYYCNGFAV